MNLIDFGVVALLVVAIVLGVRSGALPQIGGLAGALLSAATGLAMLPALTPYLEILPPTIRAVTTLSGLLLLVGLGEAVGATLGRAGSHALGRGVLGAADRLGGAVVGAAQVVLIAWLAGGILASGPVQSLRHEAQTSRVVRGLSAVLPPPTVLVVELGHVLNDSGLPDVFLGLERLPAADIALPPDAVARQLGQRVQGSVVRVVADACQVRSSGTAFVVAQGYLVTNAHVVAGSDRIMVETPRSAYTATPVLFDPELDVAVLRVQGFLAMPLVFAGSDPQRGALGATFGYPGGGNATVEPATVAATYDATGLDIDGRQSVSRRIVEMRSTVVPGDSGGPLLLTDGTVGGVVFAESRTDATVGYALSPTAVAVRIRPALGSSTSVSTGGCIH